MEARQGQTALHMHQVVAVADLADGRQRRIVCEAGHRRFVIQRDRDVSGLSGVGVVADGVAFDDGSAVVRWRAGAAGVRTTVLYDSVEELERLHGHGSATIVAWLDPDGVHPEGTRDGEQVSQERG